jgi:hypothetical protein
VDELGHLLLAPLRQVHHQMLEEVLYLQLHPLLLVPLVQVLVPQVEPTFVV